MLFLQENDKGIFVQMMSKNGERLNLKNWGLRGPFNQITLDFIPIFQLKN